MRFSVLALGILAVGSTAFADPVGCYKKALTAINFSGYEYNVKYATALCRFAWTPQAETNVMSCFRKSQGILNFSGYEYNIKYGVELCAGTEDADKTIDCFKRSQTQINFSAYEYNVKYGVQLCGSQRP